MNGIIDTKHPINITMDKLKSLRFDSAIELLNRFDGRALKITDSHGDFVNLINAKDLSGCWGDAKLFNGILKTEKGHVIHWMISKSNGQDELLKAIEEITSKLSIMSNDVKCILDGYICSDYVPNYAWLIIGGEGTKVITHRDFFYTASWNYLVFGRKKWFLWEPNRNFSKHEPSHHFLQEPGQLIWIPEGWWHKVTYTQGSICISKNLIMERSIENVVSEIRGKNTHLENVINVIFKLRRD